MGDQVDVVIVLGQSNATGWQSNRSTSYSSDPAVFAWNGSSLTTYQPNVFTGLERDVSAGYWAAELSYVTQARSARPSRYVAVLRYTAVNTALTFTGDAAPDWNPRSAGELLDGAKTFVRTGLAALRARGLTPQVRLVWWQQGEGDMDSPAPSYQADLAGMIAALRDTSGGADITNATPVVIGRLSSKLASHSGFSDIRIAQQTVAAAKVGGPQILVDEDDLAFERDGVHLTAASQLTLGARLWAVDQGAYPLLSQ